MTALAATPPPRPARPRWARVTGVVGEVLITFGVVLLLFAVYELVWTNVTANRHEADVRQDLEQQFAQPSAPAPSATSGASPSASPEATTTFDPGEGFAIMHIPALGDDWARAVVEGVALDDLQGTLGHYPDTQQPGEVGNFAVAGHRATNGEPLRDIPSRTDGSLVYVQTATAWYVYRTTSHEIVQPDAVDVVLPVPHQPGAAPTKALLTITTCHPRWASYERWIVYGRAGLRASRPRPDRPRGCPRCTRGSGDTCPARRRCGCCLRWCLPVRSWLCSSSWCSRGWRRLLPVQ